MEELSLDRLLALTRGQLFADPEGVLALINSHQPNLCRVAAIGWSVTLGPLATTTVSSSVREGFVWVVTQAEFYTDIPFAVQAVILRDNELWLSDAGVVPAIARFRNWSEAASIWQTILINTSALLTVNLHLSFTGWMVEVGTFRNIMRILAPLSYAIAAHGTPEGET